MGPASFAQAPSGATCRTISAVRRRRARNRGPRGRQRGRRAREPPGNRSQAQNSFCGENGFSGGGATSGGPKQRRRTRPSRPGARSIVPGDKGAEGGAGGRPGAARGWGGPTQAAEPERPGGAWPAPSPAGHVPAQDAGRAVAGPEHVGGRVEKQFSAKRSPAAMTGTKLPGHREAERTKAGGRSCSWEGRAGPTDKRCRKGQTTAVPAPSPAELARHNAPGGQTAGRSRTGENLRAQKAPLLPHYQSSLTRPSGSAEAGESSS